MFVISTEFSSRHDLMAKAISRAKRRHGLADGVCIVSVGNGQWDFEVAQALGTDFFGIGTGAWST